MTPVDRRQMLSAFLALGSVVSLSGCSSTPARPAPTPLTALNPVVTARQVWKIDVGPVALPVQMWTSGDRVAVASSQGQVALIDAAAGQEQWRVAVGAPVVAGVGGDGQHFAVVTRANELVMMQTGRVLWRKQLPAVCYTAPLVAGGRVFVLTADRAVTAFDARDGLKLWTQARVSDPLVLARPGLLVPVGDTLLAGLAGRLVGLNPDTGQPRWETLIGTSRGTNEIERLVDLVGGVHRDGLQLCVRSFQSSVACIDTRRGQLVWSRTAQGHSGLSGDAQNVYGVESDDRLQAWSASSGEPVWRQDVLRYRVLTAPVLSAGSVVVGDAQGVVHWVDRADGQLRGRMVPDGSSISLTPVQAGNTLVVVTAKGAVFGYRPA